MKIRKGTKEDIPAIYDLVIALAVYEKEPEAVTAPLSAYYEAFAKEDFYILVAEIDKKVIGMMLYYRAFSTWKGPMLYLEDFVVDEAYRGQGVGEQLFHKLISHAMEMGVVKVKWQVLDWNTPAIKFYEKIGAIIEKEWWNGTYLTQLTPNN